MVAETSPCRSDVVAGQELVAVPSVVAAKLALYTAMRRQRVTQVDLGRRLVSCLRNSLAVSLE